MALEMQKPSVQGLQGMELGGFEPPTSWVRSKAVARRESVRKMPISRAF